MARGRVRPIKKFLCHISLTLGFPGDNKPQKKTAAKKTETASAPVQTPVKTSGSTKAKKTSTSPSSSK
jgi:hypothetical protein